MQRRNLLALILPLMFLGAFALNSWAAGVSTVRLRAIRTTLLADGKQSTDVIAEVRDSSGRPVTGNVSVQFSATAGQLSSNQAFTNFSGEARVRLTSGPIAGISHVTAFTPGATTDTLDIEFTDDPEATFSGNNYMAFQAATYLAYSATDRVIEADGKDGGGKMNYRNLEISADRLQLRCSENIVRAQDNITFRRGADVIKATRLYYNLQSSQGFAVAPDEKGQLVTYKLLGEHLRREISDIPAPSSYMMMPDFQHKLVIVARSITYFPGDRLQFRRPRFFQDTAQIMSLPYYELPLNSQELFSDQFISVGTSGFGLDLPFYYQLTPKQQGIVYLRHQQQVGRGFYATEPGWAIDVVEGYSSQGAQRYEGAVALTGLTRGDWGARFTHNQEFNSSTNGSFYLDFPHHNSIYSSANFGQQGKVLRWGANLSGGQTLVGPTTSSIQSELFVETQPRRLMGSRDVMYTLGTNYSNTVSRSKLALTGIGSQTIENVGLRAFTRPLVINSRTSLTNSLSLGQMWAGAAGSGVSAAFTSSLDHTLPGGGSINLTYDYASRPTGVYLSEGKHRLSSSLTLAGSKRLQLSIIGTMLLDADESNLMADISYRLDSRWRILGSATLDRFGDQTFQDFEITLGRRVGARELQFSYSTLLKRISFDMTATRF